MIGAVLAGGAGRRMGGRDKASILLQGRPLVEWALDAVRGAGLQPTVVGADVPGVPRCPEPDDGPRHPARGIAAAIDWAGGPVVVVACDLPFVPPRVLAALAAETGTVCVAGQPLVGRYEDADVLRAAARDGTPLHALGQRELDPARYGDPAWTRYNVNTPMDLEMAQGVMTE